ncbi:MAG: rod shape-determining protein MreD [Candidatus Kapaibacterium sp.]|nr:rod shape-determining protein MreD [Ignavibacteriota bacterium]MCB9220306.1 rod shape-determining protein MreD [Ignavibacteria bacterium]
MNRTKKKINHGFQRYVVYAIVAILLSLIQFSLLNFVEVQGITPDLLLILCVWIAIREGRFTGIIAGFLIGITLDIVSFDLVGINAFTKTIAGFVAGSFYQEGKEQLILHGLKFLLIVFISSFIHNLIYFFFYIKLSDITFVSFFLKYGIAFSFYTTVFAVIPMLIKRKERII